MSLPYTPLRNLLILTALLVLCACAAGWGGRVHTVKKGDTLWSIAYAHHVDWKDVARWNDLKPPYTIYLGQKLQVSPPDSSGQQMAFFTPSRSPLRTRNNSAHKSHSKQTSSKSQTKNKGSRSRPVKSKPTTKTKTRTKKASPTIRPATRASGDIAWQWPISKQRLGRAQVKSTRHGIDIYAPAGTPVRAAANGQVVYSGKGLQDFGKLIIIQHTDNELSAYSYLSSVAVQEGAQVKAGQKIASMGVGPGNKTSLHFEVRRQGDPLKPLHVLPKR